MKRFIQALQVAVFLMLLSVSMPVQAGTITGGLSATPAMIDIGANSKVRFTYTADIAPFGQQVLVFLERDANGMITQNIVGSFSGYGSGTCCTTLATGKAAVVLVSNGGPAPTYEIQYFADSPSTVNGDLGVAGNENVYGKLTVMDKLGVGTSTPSAKLDVNMPATLNGTDILASFLRTRSSTGGSGIVRIGANSTADLEINSGYSSAGLRYGSYFDFNMVNNNTGGQYGGINFVTNAVARLSIKANGNVGIGTATPGAKLDVRVSEPLGQGAGNYLPLTRINGNGAANNIYINDYMLRESGGSDWLSASYIRGISVDASFLEPSTLRSWIKQKPFDEKIEFGSSGKTLMSIGKDNTTQEARVTVDGTFHAREVTVDLNTSLADYVFSPSYTLMPLHKVEEYVKANSHLPEIPSAAEVKENGLSMGEMQNKLLQKIEELTLYMIEQQKQINDLKAQLQGK